MTNALSGFTNLPELSSHDGDEDLIELGRKFGNALDRMGAAAAVNNDGEYDLAIAEADKLVEASKQLKATTILGLRIKAWMTFFIVRSMEGSEDDGRVCNMVYSLLRDLVPPNQQHVPGDARDEAA